MTDGTDARLIEVAKELLDQTTIGNVAWVPTDDDEAFLYTTSRASIIVDTARGRSPQHYWLRILNERGTEIEAIVRYNDPNDWGQDGEELELLRNLHDAARRNALKIDAVIDGVLADLRDLPPF